MTATASKFEYKPLYKPNQLSYGTGQVAIVTGWTVKSNLQKRLHPQDYAVIGQLYSPTRGINLLIRNLLFNPHVGYLIVLNATKEDRNAGACECLLDFFRNGFFQSVTDAGHKAWKINSSVTGYIDIEVEATALEKLRKSIEYKEVNSIEKAVVQTQSFGAIAVTKENKIWGSPLEFPMLVNQPTVLPGNRYAHRIEGKTIAETWVKIIHRIKTTGVIRPTGYDGKWQELIDLMAIITDEPANFYFPEPNYLPVNRDFIQEYLSQIIDDAPYQEGVKYTYGQRLRSWFGCDQIEQVINKLIKEIDAASAVMNLWDVKDHQKGGSPCLNHIWLRVIDKEISLTATLRSNDMFSAWVANAMGLRALQQHIRNEIQARSKYALKMGPLITISQSAHIYDDTWDSADRLIQQQYAKIYKNIDYCDRVGNFLIEVLEDKVVVTQTTPGSGEVVAQYSGKNPLKLVREICTASPAIRSNHAAYLGIELQKAVECLKIDKQYIQDSK
ncbi:MAG: thymidylate synthase [Cyanobacteria bacterium J06632_19]